MNSAFDVYREMYYEGGVASVFLWDLEDGFAGVVLLKKSNEASGAVSTWDSGEFIILAPFLAGVFPFPYNLFRRISCADLLPVFCFISPRIRDIRTRSNGPLQINLDRHALHV